MLQKPERLEFGVARGGMLLQSETGAKSVRSVSRFWTGFPLPSVFASTGQEFDTDPRGTAEKSTATSLAPPRLLTFAPWTSARREGFFGIKHLEIEGNALIDKGAGWPHGATGWPGANQIPGRNL